MATYNFTITQSGNEATGWNAVPTLGDGHLGGFRFLADLPGFLWQTTTAGLYAPLDDGGPGTATVYVVDQPNCQPFSNSNRPSRLPQVLVGTGTGTPTSTTPISIPISLNNSTGQATRVRATISAGSSTANLGLLVVWSGADFQGDLSLSGTYTNDFTGLEGPWRALGRADRCPKCGFPSTRDTWVRDGYTQMRVCPKCYDPPDEVGRSPRTGRELPPVGEN